MTIQMRQTIDLTSPEVQAFVMRAAQPDFFTPISVRAGQRKSAVAGKLVDNFEHLTDAAGVVTPLASTYSRIEHYAVFKRQKTGGHGANQGYFDVTIYLTQELRATVNAVLLINTALETAATTAAIENAFTAYNNPADGDPSDYMSRSLRANPVISAAMFEVVCKRH